MLLNILMKIILLMKHAAPTRLLVGQMDLDVQQLLNVKIVLQVKDVGHNKELRFIQLVNMLNWLVKS